LNIELYIDVIVGNYDMKKKKKANFLEWSNSYDLPYLIFERELTKYQVSTHEHEKTNGSQ
jgi:hypothetical protein